MRLAALSDRELVAGLMRGNRSELKLGYSPMNAALTVQHLRPESDRDELRGYSEGFSDGMRHEKSMVVSSDPANTENEAYRDGYLDGQQEDLQSAYPSEESV